MSVMERALDRVKAFFDKEPKNRDLSPSVVTHDRIDDGYLDDLRTRSTGFQGVINHAPDVALGKPPKQCPSCGHDEAPVWWEQDGATISCKSCEAPVAMPTGPYTLWGDMVGDMWRAHFTHDEPRVRPPQECKPSHELHRRIMSSVLAREGFMNTRAMTRLDDVESAFAAMGAAGKLRESITEGALAEHARRAEEMASHEADIENLERALEKHRQAWQDDKLTDDDKAALQDLAQKHDDSTAQLEAVQADAAANPINQKVIDEIGEAVQAAFEEAEAMDTMVKMATGGSAGGPGDYVDPDKMFALAEVWKNNEVLQKVSELMGRLEREMRYRRANRVVGGFEEIVDLETGNNPALMLPMEGVQAMDEDLELLFYKKFLEQDLLQFEIRGNEPEGKGPVVILRDGSASMDGDRFVWATAVALAIVNIAHKERRDAAVIEFGSAEQQKLWFFPGRGTLIAEEVVECASHFFRGGTRITEAVKFARRNVMEKAPAFKKADLCIITDGESKWDEKGEREKSLLINAGVRIHGVAVGSGAGYLGHICDHLTKVSDLDLKDGDNDATTSLAENIT